MTLRVWIPRPAATLLLLFVLTALGTIAYTHAYASRRLAAIAYVRRAAGVIDLEQPAWWPRGVACPEWMRETRRIDFYAAQCDLRCFAALRDVKSLTCRGVVSRFDRLGQFRKLEYLELSESNVTDDDLASLRTCRRLSHIRIANTAVGDRGLECLAGLPLLTISLNETQVSDAGLRHLQTCPVQLLDLTRTHITDTGLEHLARMRLNELFLSQTLVTDPGLRHLTAIKSLRFVDLKGTGITDAGLEHLGKIMSLLSLDLSRTAITDRGLEHLVHLPLKNLDLTGTPITDAGASTLTRLPLERLNLSDTAITTAAFPELARLRSLEQITVSHPRFSDWDVAPFTNAKVWVNFDPPIQVD